MNPQTRHLLGQGLLFSGIAVGAFEVVEGAPPLLVPLVLVGGGLILIDKNPDGNVLRSDRRRRRR